MSYYTYDGDNLVLAEDPPDATYVSRGEGEDGTTRYYIYDSAGRGVGSTTQSPPPGTRRAAPDAINEEGLLDVSRAHQAYADGSWQKAAEYALGAQAENAISELTKVNPNYDWTASIKQAADQLNAAYGSDWQSPNRGSPGGVVAGILQTPAAQSDPAIPGRVSQVLPYFKNKQHQDDVNILAEQSTHGSEGDMQMQFLTGVLGGALGGYYNGIGAGEGALSAQEFAANAGVGASNTTGALSSFAESLKSFTDLIPPELKSAMDSLPPAAKKALVGAITNPQDPIGGAIKGGVLGATGGELSSALISAGVNPSIAKMLTQSATQFIQTETIDPTKLAMSALTPEISGGLKDLGVPPEALNAATNAVKQLVSTGQINAEQLALGAGNEAVSKALTDAGIPSNYVKLVGTAVASAVTGNNLDLGSIASAVLSGDKKQRSQDSEDEAIARDVQDETDRQKGAIAKVQTAADQETEDQAGGAIAKEQAAAEQAKAEEDARVAAGDPQTGTDKGTGAKMDDDDNRIVDQSGGGSLTGDDEYVGDIPTDPYAGGGEYVGDIPTDPYAGGGEYVGDIPTDPKAGDFTAAELKAEAERLKNAGKTAAQIKAALGAAAKKLGIDLGSGKSIVGAIGDWIKDNPPLAALSGGLVAAILADRNKEQKLTTTRSLTPENQKAVSGAITDLANSNAYKPTLGMTGDQTGALATLKGVTDTKYTDPMAAALATNQQGAIDLASKKQGNQQATIEAAKVGTVNAAKGIPTANLTPYMNQYTMAALNPQLEQYDRDTQKQQQGLSSQAVKAGAFGGSRFGLMGTELDRNRDFVRQGTVNTAMKDAFDRATTLYGVDKARELQSAGQLQSIATAGGALESQDVKDLASTGALQQTTDQNAKDKAYAEFLRQQNAQAGYAGTALETANTVAKSDIGQNQFTAQLPANNATALANLANTTATTTNVGTPPSLLSQLAGAGTALYGVSQLLPKTKTAAVTP